MLSFIFFLQDNAGSLDWTGDQIRTILMTLITGLVGFSARILYCLRDDMRDVKRDIHGDKDGKGGLLEAVTDHNSRIMVLERKRFAQEVLEQSERDSFQGPEKRHHLRRARDVINEAFASDEHPTKGE